MRTPRPIHPDEDTLFERWKPIRDDDGNIWPYSVSTCGRVRNDRTGRIMRTYENADPPKNYLRAFLKATRTCGRRKFYVQRLVAIAFVEGRSKEKTDVHHRDGNPLNNHTSNLQWVTNEENQIYRYVSPVHNGEDDQGEPVEMPDFSSLIGSTDSAPF